MRRRYDFLLEGDIFKALNKVRDAFLTAKDGGEVDQVMNGVLTFDERVKVGRRIQIAQCLFKGMSMDEIKAELGVGYNTISHVKNRLDKYKRCFELIDRRTKKVENEYKKGAYIKVGGSTKVFKETKYTGLKRKDIKR